MSDTLQRLASVIESRKPANGGDPEKSYIARLFAKGDDAILKKIGEEATEVVIAALSESRERMISEIADLVFHVTGISGTIFSGFSADQLRKIIEDAFKLWKHLRMIASFFTVLMRGSDSVREIFCPPMSASTSNRPA